MSAVLTILILVFADCITFWIISSQIKSNRLEDKLHFSVTPTPTLKEVWEYISHFHYINYFISGSSLTLPIFIFHFGYNPNSWSLWSAKNIKGNIKCLK